ncbi:UNKNOWN [Stylonychia lemnae]|uniref:J domain-containing protein n=1 Tax=Stylonychia lemnae TaxID=5949 RepID=A0A078AAV9_STYLE|nr:UNKNOWN [Stylonychia lemnae]|eukprot:CDW77928.1 UNKNOWN [Stylonychia lemnae]
MKSRSTLNVTAFAEMQEIKRAYYNLAKLYHPDSKILTGFNDQQKQSKFREVQAAYEYLIQHQQDKQNIHSMDEQQQNYQSENQNYHSTTKEEEIKEMEEWERSKEEWFNSQVSGQKVKVHYYSDEEDSYQERYTSQNLNFNQSEKLLTVQNSVIAIKILIGACIIEFLADNQMRKIKDSYIS